MNQKMKRILLAFVFFTVVCLGVTFSFMLHNNEIKLTIDYDSEIPYTEMTLQFSNDVFIVSDIDTMKNDVSKKLSLSFSPQLKYTIKPLDSRACIIELYDPKPAQEYYFTINVKGIDSKNLRLTVNNNEIELGKEYFFATPVLEVIQCQRESKQLNSPILVQFNFPVSIDVLRKKITIRPDVTFSLQYDEQDKSHKKVIIVPENERKAQKYSLKIDRTMLPVGGSKPMNSSFDFSYETYYPFTLLDIQSSYSRYYNDSSFYPDYPIELSFNNEIALPHDRSINEYVKVSPHCEGLLINVYGSIISISGNFIGKKSYTVTVASTLPDVYGQTLGKTIQKEIEFKHAFSYFSCPTGYMIYENYLEKILPFRIVNVSSFSLKYCSLVDEKEILAYFENPQKYFSAHAKVKTYPLKWSWDIFKTIKFDFSKLHQSQSGFFIYELSPVMEHPYSTHDNVYRGIIQFSDIGVTVKKTKQELFLHVRDLLNNRPLSSAMVYSTGSDVEIGKTDAKGVIIFKNNKYSLITVKHNNSVFYYSLHDTNGEYETNSQQNITVPEKHYGNDYYITKPEIHLFTDRYLYKPGETVHIKGILRYRNNDEWSLVPPKSPIPTITLTIYNSRDEEVSSSRRRVSETGALQWDVPLKDDSPTGYYRIHIDAKNKDYDLEKSISFQVEDFKPAKAEMKIIPSKLKYVWGDVLTVDLFGWYLFGAPVNNDVDYTVALQPVDYRSDTYADYSFSTRLNYYDEYDEYTPPSTTIATGTVKVDEKGVGKVIVPLKALSNIPNAQLTITGRTYLPDKSPVFGVKTGIEVMEPVHVGIKIPSYFNSNTKPVTIHCIAVNNNDQVVPNTSIVLVIKKHEWKSFQIAGVNGRLQWEYKKIENEVYAKNHTIGKNEIVVSIQDAGYYTAEVYDTSRKRKFAVADFYCIGAGEAGWRVNDDETVDVETDKKSYDVGQTAMLLIKNPFNSAVAFVTIEREKFYEYFEVPATSSIVMIPIPIKREYIPNVYVSVMLYAGRTGFNAYKDGQDVAKPKCFIGYANLKVNPKEKQLHITIAHNKKQYQPKDTVTLNLYVTDVNGNPINGEATISVADKGVLNLVNYRLPDPFELFYAPRQLAVTTFDVRQLLLGQRYVKEKGELIGGDGGIATLGMIVPRADIRYSAFYQATVPVVDGSAKCTFTLPDNLTSFASMVVVHTPDSKFGYGEAMFEVKKPLMVLPTFPRFLRSGDSFSAGALVFNYTGKKDDVQVSLQLEGGLTLHNGSKTVVKTITLKDGESKEITFPLIVPKNNSTSAHYTIRAKASQYTDGIKDTIPVKAPNIFETVALYGRITQKQAKEVKEITISNAIIPEASFIDVYASASAFIDLKGSLDYLVEYPYGCLEQKASKILPLIIAEDIIIKRGLLKTKTASDIRLLVAEVLREFPAYYNNGGFAYWKNSASVDSYLTVYATFILTLAKKRGYVVDETLYNTVSKTIQQFVRKGTLFSDNDRDSLYKYLTLSFAHYVAALQGYTNEDALKLVYSALQRKSDMCITAYAYLLKAIALYPQSSFKSTMMNEIARTFFSRMRSESGYVYFDDSSQWGYFYYDSVIATALILQALIEAGINFENDFKVVNYLLKQRKGYAWLNTHQNAVIWWALNSYLTRYEKVEPHYSLKVLVDTKELINEILTAGSSNIAIRYKLEKQEGKKQYAFIKDGEGPLYYALRFNYVPVYSAMTSKNMGFALTKKYKEVISKKEVNTFIKGSEYIVEIEVYTPKNRGITVLDDQLPAALEPVNISFATEEKMQEENGKKYDTWGTFNHYEQYKDRVVYYADFMQKGTHKVMYKVRATNAGVFTLPACKVEEMYNPEVCGILYFTNTISIK